MIANLRREGAAYVAIAAMVPKTLLAFGWSTWVRVFQSIIGMVVFVYFWRAIYAHTASIAGLSLEATLGYILLARIFQPLGYMDLVFEFGYNLTEGAIAYLLVRPLDLQLAYYAEDLATVATGLVRQVPVTLLAVLFFGLRFPADPVVWAVFILSAVIGRSVLFCMDWILGCITFYTTEVWGLHTAVLGLTAFLSGGLVPLNMMPAWLRLIVQNTPFAQAIYVPISLLSGVTPLSQAPRLLSIQVVWLIGMALLSRLVFRVAVRRLTVQGG
jgi:ABC-2 type transport system permease protein